MKLVFSNLGSAIVLTLNILFIHSAVLGVIFGLIFICLSSFLLGKILFKNHSSDEQKLFGFLTFLSITIITLTIVYYFYQLNDWVVIIFILCNSIILLLFDKNKNTKNSPLSIIHYLPRPASPAGRRQAGSLPLTHYFLILLYLLTLAISYFLLKSGATLEAVRTPWIFVPKTFFIAYFLATAVLIYLNTKLKSIYILILTCLHLFFSFSIANIIFPLGFGYDPFIHQATEKHILDFGFILPKNFYYLGQYSLVIFLTKIFQISHVIIDKNLVPLLASILLPATILYAFKKLDFPLYFIHYTLYIFLLIPFSVFTFTTPQNLADLLIIIIAFLGFRFLITHYLPTGDLPKGDSLLLLLSLATILIHPIAGMAAFIFLILLWTKNKLKKSFYFLVSLFLSFSFIFIFFIYSKISNLNKIEIINNFNLINFYNNIFRFSPDLFLNTNIVHLFKTTIYFLWQPMVVFMVILGLAIYGIFKIKKNYRTCPEFNSGSLVTCLALPRRQADGRQAHPSLLIKIFLILSVNSFLVFSFINFSFLIDYERGDFSWRIFNLGIYFLIPLAIYGAIFILKKMFNLLTEKKQNWIPAFAGMTIVMVASGITASVYFSYPRQDVYMLNRGFNTSIHDFEAVKYLDKITPEPYAVLANQQIGAAALTEFGFRYFDHKYFFYSIPTGGELYQIYAKMAYDEIINYQIVEKVMTLTGVRIVYLYLPDYWFNLKKIKPQLEAMADETLKLENGKVWVFKFVKK